jgi:hypothetical protein
MMPRAAAASRPRIIIVGQQSPDNVYYRARLRWHFYWFFNNILDVYFQRLCARQALAHKVKNCRSPLRPVRGHAEASEQRTIKRRLQRGYTAI